MTAENTIITEDPNIVEVLAQYLMGRIKREDLSEHNQSLLDYYGPGGLMSDDLKFAAQVNSKKNQILTVGERIPLYTSDEIKKAKRHGRHKKITSEISLQPRLWAEPQLEDPIPTIVDAVFDPEKKIKSKQRNELITEEIEMKKRELREMIGLPVARGKDPHVNDDFYKYLVRRIYHFDVFHIFKEYDRVLDEVPKDLSSKINQVRDLISELLNGGLNMGERYGEYHKFIEEHEEEWNIFNYSRE